jgi:CcmD family protein
MQNLPYLFATYAIVWLVLFGYLFVVAAQVRSVQRDVDLLREQVGAAAHPAGGDPESGVGAGPAAPRGEGV